MRLTFTSGDTTESASRSNIRIDVPNVSCIYAVGGARCISVNKVHRVYNSGWSYNSKYKLLLKKTKLLKKLMDFKSVLYF